LPEIEDGGFTEGPGAERTATDAHEREGLPPGFRMRADAHYVDVLTSRRGEAAREGGRGGRPRPAFEWDDDPAPPEARHAVRELPIARLAEDLATIQGAAALLSNETSPLVRRVSLDLVNMHAARAAWALKADALVSGAHRGERRGKRLGALLSQIRETLAPICRLSNVSLQVQVSDWEAVVEVDADALEIGLTGAVIATLGLVRSDESAVIRILATEQNGELRTIDVTQEDVGLPETLGRRFFDPAYIDRSGGWAAGLGAAAARTAARLHGGDATLLIGERRGGTIRISL
jgi:hypothetical protein